MKPSSAIVRQMYYTWISGRAFNSVSHDKLLIKLQMADVKGNLLSWFKFYLSSCCEYSKFCNALSGVPHGSVLRPLLFFIIINDIPDSLLFLLHIHIC